MPISLKSLNAPVRYNYPDNDGEEWIELRLVSSDKMDEFRKKLGIKSTSKFVYNPTTKRMESVADFNLPEERMLEFNDFCTDYQIAAWNLVEPDGTAIECSLVNKKLLMSGEPKFAAWVNARLNKMQGQVNEIESAEIKN